MISVHRKPRTARLLRAFLLTLLSALLVLAAAPAGRAGADAPIRLPANLVDAAAVLDPQQEASVAKAIDDLSRRHDIDLWVVLVNDFGGLSPRDFAARTADLSELSYHDVLLTISTSDRTYALNDPESIEDLSRSELDRIGSQSVRPAVEKSQWTEAITDTAGALGDATGESYTWRIVLAVVGVLLVLAVLALLVLRRRPGRDDATAGRHTELTVDQLASRPIGELEPWAAECLIATDNAVSASADELALARAEAGSGATGGFDAALHTAESALATSFRLRRRLDETPDLTEDERRTLLIQIIAMCSDADAALDAQATAFDGVRDLLDDPQARITAVEARLAELTARFGSEDGELDALAPWSDSPLATSVTGNVDLARELSGFAADALAQGREVLADADTGDSPAAAAVRSAEAAVDAAGRLLDGVDDATENLRRAADGRSGGADTTTALEQATVAVAAAENFLDTRRAAVGVVARTELSEAERLLDAAQTAGSPAGAEDAGRARALAEQALAHAQADVTAWLAGPTPDGDLAAVLTGVLVDAVVTEEDAATAQWARGYTSGGRSPVSFGGPETGGRIGTGGRH